PGHTSKTVPMDGDRSIAVMPFTVENPAHATVAEWLADELRDLLTRIRGLRVKSLKMHPSDLVGVDFVTMGTFQQTGDVVHLTLALTRVDDGVELWADRFE